MDQCRGTLIPVCYITGHASLTMLTDHPSTTLGLDGDGLRTGDRGRKSIQPTDISRSSWDND